MNIIGSSSGCRSVVAVAVAAAAICVCGGSAYGAGVQVSLASSFNADTVLRYNGGVFTAPTISWDNSASGGSVDNWLVTQSAANRLASIQGGSNPVGLNDTGFYPASGARLYDVQLGFTNATATGTNTAIRSTVAGSFSFTVPNGQYSQFAIFGSGGSGSSTLTITLNYLSGSPTMLTNVTLPDWYSGIPSTTAAGAAGTYFALTPAMSRQAAYDFPNAGYEAPSGGAYIYGINLAPDSTRVLASVSVNYAPSSPGYTVANFLTAAGAIAPTSSSSTPSVPALGALGLVLLAVGLTLICWFSLRGQRAT
jgi:hypothetical protein